MTDAKKLSKGDRLSRVSYMDVVSVLPTNIKVRNEHGLVWYISKDIISQECYSTQYDKDDVKKVSKTEIAEILVNARDAIIEVNFNKQATVESIEKNLDVLETLSESGIRKKLKSLLDGDKRTLIGYVIGSEPILGRSYVIDLEKDSGNNPNHDARQRLVDHRTINWLVYKNIKYVVK
jgi:hypothetical protein